MPTSPIFPVDPPKPNDILAKDQDGKWKFRRTPQTAAFWAYLPASAKLPDPDAK